MSPVDFIVVRSMLYVDVTKMSFMTSCAGFSTDLVGTCRNRFAQIALLFSKLSNSRNVKSSSDVSLPIFKHLL